MSVLRLLWDTAVASIVSFVLLVGLATMTNNIGLLYLFIIGWWVLPPVWFAILGTWSYLKHTRKIV
jgi:hypothetical protein